MEFCLEQILKLLRKLVISMTIFKLQLRVTVSKYWTRILCPVQGSEIRLSSFPEIIYHLIRSKEQVQKSIKNSL